MMQLDSLLRGNESDTFPDVHLLFDVISCSKKTAISR